MERRQRRSFTDDYKRQAVDLVASSGRSVGPVARELGCAILCCAGGWSNVGLGES
jgi:transposase-like protein